MVTLRILINYLNTLYSLVTIDKDFPIDDEYYETFTDVTAVIDGQSEVSLFEGEFEVEINRKLYQLGDLLQRFVRRDKNDKVLLREDIDKMCVDVRSELEKYMRGLGVVPKARYSKS